MYAGIIDEVAFNGFEPDARQQEYTIYSASPIRTVIKKFKNHYVLTCAIYGARTG